ncbi:histidine phosphatase family protein [soil metagenome]
MTDSFEVAPGLSATLVFVRHGESVWIAEGRFQGRRDPPLSPLGRRQAMLVAQRLADRTATGLPIPDGPPTGIWHSPLSRAAETARAIADEQPAPTLLHTTEDLIELGQGQWEGLLHAEVNARWADELAAWRRTPTQAQAPDGEPLLAAAGRVSAALGQLTRALAGASVRPGASSDQAGDVASLAPSPVPGYPTLARQSQPDSWAILVAHDGIFRLAVMTLLGLPYEHFWSLPFSLCAISVVGLNDGVATLRAHNLADHLAPLASGARAATEARGDRRGAL